MANSEPEVRNGIEFHKGNTNILLIAPHGVETVPMDDENTAALVRRIQGQTGFSALINTLFRKPEGPLSKKRNKGKLDLQNNFANLNKIKQAEQVKDYITKIKKVVDTDGLTYVIWIHGIKDKHIRVFGDDIQCLIGYGQPGIEDPSPRETAEQEFIDLLEKELNEKGIKSILAPANSKYRGWSEDYMNQWFRLNNYDFKQVQSVQLEFRWTGCRDTDESIETTAKKLAYAISAVVQTAAENNQSSDKAQVPEIISDPEEVKDAIEVGEPVYDPLVETAYLKLSQVFSKNYERALMEAGQYIVRTFYGGEEGIEDQGYDENMVLSQETIENARVNKSQRKASLHQLFQKLNENTNSKAPSRGWFYNAVNLVVQHHDMKKLLKTRFHTYGNLFLSHKVALLKVKDLTKKQKLIEEESKNPSTVRDFIQKVQKLLPPGTDEPLPLPSLLRKPDELIKEENAERFTIEALKSTQARTLNNLKKITDEQQENIETEINHLKDELEKWEKVSKTYITTTANIEKAIELKKSKPKKNKPKNKKEAANPNQDWADDGINVSTGCSHNCRYCYARDGQIRKKNKTLDTWHIEEPRPETVNKRWGKTKRRKLFPSIHDITPGTYPDSVKVIKKFLKPGNMLLIVSKPHPDLIEKLCDEIAEYKGQVLFRFTISAMDKELLKFWEPGAPSFEDRLKALKIAREKGFETSISVEPMLDTANISELIEALKPHTTDSIWLGTMNNIGRRVKDKDNPEVAKQIQNIEAGQTTDKLATIYEDWKGEPLVKYKSHIRNKLAEINIEVPKTEDDWRERRSAKKSNGRTV